MKSNPKIRTARLEEKEALEALQTKASLVHETYRAALIAHPDAISIPSGQIAAGRVFVADVDGAVGGFAAVLTRADGEMELDGLFVDPAFWRRGIGRALVDHCLGFSKALNAKALVVVANPDALDFYFACGFIEVGVEQTRFGSAKILGKKI